MASKPYIPRQSAQVPTQAYSQKLGLLSSSSSGSFPIRAPLTLYDSDFESNNDVDKTSSSGGNDSGFESEGFISGEEFETASERPFVADPDEETLENGGDNVKYETFRPYVVDFEGETIDYVTEEEEESSEVGEFVPPVETTGVHSLNVTRVMPIAQLSRDDDDDDEEEVEEMVSEEEDSQFLSVVRVAGIGAPGKLGDALRIKALGAEEREGDDCNSSITSHPLPANEVKFTDGLVLGIQENKTLVVKEHGPNTFFEDRGSLGAASVVCGESLITTGEDIMLPNLEDVNVNLFDEQKKPFDEFEKDGRNQQEGDIMRLSGTNGVSVDSTIQGKLEVDAEETNQMVEGASVMVSDNDKLKSDSEDDDDSERPQGKTGDIVTQAEKQNPQTFINSSCLIDEHAEDLTLGSTESCRQFMEQISSFTNLLSTGASCNGSQQVGQIVTKGNIKMDIAKDDEAKQLLDAGASSMESHGRRVTITSADDSKVISMKDSAAFGSLLHCKKPTQPLYHSVASDIKAGGDNVSEKEKESFEKIPLIIVKFLRLIQRLNLCPEDSLVAQILYRLVAAIGIHSGQEFSLGTAKTIARKFEEDGKDDIDFSLNILILGKSGVGKSATINSIFGEAKVKTDAFKPATTSIEEVFGTIDGIKIRILDTPGLGSSAMEQAFNRKILSSVKKYIKKFPPDIVLYVDRVDTLTSDFIDLPLLKSITSSLKSSIWKSAIITLTHAAAVPLDGPSGSPISYEVLVARKSHVVQQSIKQAIGDVRLMSDSVAYPVTLVENHPLCGNNIFGECVLPDGFSWRTQLLLMCFSLKLFAEVIYISSEPHNILYHWKQWSPFGFWVHSSSVPFLSSFLPSHAYLNYSPNLSSDNVESDIDLA